MAAVPLRIRAPRIKARPSPRELAFRKGADYSLYLLASRLGVESRDVRRLPLPPEEKAARLAERILRAFPPEE